MWCSEFLTTNMGQDEPYFVLLTPYHYPPFSLLTRLIDHFLKTTASHSFTLFFFFFFLSSLFLSHLHKQASDDHRTRVHTKTWRYRIAYIYNTTIGRHSSSCKLYSAIIPDQPLPPP